MHRNFDKSRMKGFAARARVRAARSAVVAASGAFVGRHYILCTGSNIIFNDHKNCLLR